MRTAAIRVAAVAVVFLSILVGISLHPSVANSSSIAKPAERVGGILTLTKHSHRLGKVPDSRRLKLEIALQPRNVAALSDLAASVSMPGSPNYHHYISTNQFASQFGADAATITAVRSTLQSEGLQVGEATPNHLSVSVTGTARQVERAFSLTLDNYSLPSGQTVFANSNAPLIAGSIANDVQSVIGLSDMQLAEPNVELLPKSGVATSNGIATGGPQLCSSLNSLPVLPQPGGYTFDQFAAAYGFSALYKENDFGAGVTVALPEFEASDPTDLAAFLKCYGLSTSVSYLPVDGGTYTFQPGDGVETSLDAETVAALAPQASIAIYQAKDQEQDNYDTYEQIIDSHQAQVLSTSWGQCEADWSEANGSVDGTSNDFSQAENVLFQEAATVGISVLSASGDEGSAGCNRNINVNDVEFDNIDHTDLAVQDPSSQPYVTAVGGTTLLNPGTVSQSETAWTSTRSGLELGGGGGISYLWQMPSYQTSAAPSLGVVNANSFTPNTESLNPATNVAVYSDAAAHVGCDTSTHELCREVPDVSADADTDAAYEIYVQGTWARVLGTSAATPLWGALVALADASPTCRALSQPSGSSAGFINPSLYAIAASPVASFALNDITQGSNDPNGNGFFPATAGYDMATGLGSPRGLVLTQLLCSGIVNSQGVLSTNTPIISGLSTTAGTAGTQVTITGVNLSGITAVNFGHNNLATNLVSTNATSLTINAPTQALGAQTVDITATSAAGTSTTSTFDKFTYGAPTVNNLSVHASAGGTTALVISGTGLLHANLVTVGSTTISPWNFTVNSDSSLSVTAPAGTSGTVPVTVSDVQGTSATSNTTQFTYGAPSVASVTPASGPTTGGTSITIAGTQLLNATSVKVGGITASFAVNSDSSITALTPAGASGDSDITVVNEAGTSAIGVSDKFTFITPFIPPAGPSSPPPDTTPSTTIPTTTVATVVTTIPTNTVPTTTIPSIPTTTIVPAQIPKLAVATASVTAPASAAINSTVSYTLNLAPKKGQTIPSGKVVVTTTKLVTSKVKINGKTVTKTSTQTITVATGTLKNGVVKLNVKTAMVGTGEHALKISYAGNGKYNPVVITKQLKVTSK